ncbi:hypothetical protein BG015_011229, partial [Linnemannia schmuckeri]
LCAPKCGDVFLKHTFSSIKTISVAVALLAVVEIVQAVSFPEFAKRDEAGVIGKVNENLLDLATNATVRDVNACKRSGDGLVDIDVRDNDIRVPTNINVDALADYLFNCSGDDLLGVVVSDNYFRAPPGIIVADHDVHVNIAYP